MAAKNQSKGYWQAAGQRLWENPLAKLCIAILVIYFGLALASALGWVASDWGREVGVSYANPSFMANLDNPQGANSAKGNVTGAIDAESRAIDPLAPYYDQIDAGVIAAGRRQMGPRRVDQGHQGW